MKFIPNNISKAVATKVLKAKHKSPHVFFAAGVAGVVGATFLACKATLKLEETIDEITDELQEVKARDNNRLPDKSADSDYYKDVVYVYGKSAVKLGRLYGPAVGLGAISIASLTGAHVQLARRNAALTAAFAGLTKTYNEYRARVIEEIGAEREKDIYMDLRNEEFEDEKGKKKVERVIGPNGFSPYARMFDEQNPNFLKNAEMNRIFLQVQQNYLNDKLNARGYVFLNEAYDQLDMPHSKAGQVVGWVLDDDGDGFIDFGLHEATAAGFTDGYEPRVILDFNVDGNIFEKFHEKF